jgi:hypothetical protein
MRDATSLINMGSNFLIASHTLHEKNILVAAIPEFKSMLHAIGDRYIKI